MVQGEQGDPLSLPGHNSFSKFAGLDFLLK